MIHLCLLAVLVDSTVEVPASRWKIILLPVTARGMQLDAAFRAPAGASRVAMILLTREDALRFDAGRSVKPLSTTAWTHEGLLRYRFRAAGNYALVIDNRIEGRRPTPVSVRVDVSRQDEITVQELPLERRIAVIATSLLLFVAIVMYAARKFAS